MLFSSMESKFYKAAAEGKFEIFENMEESELLNLLTPNKNTILHIRITSSTDDDKSEFVKNVLEKFSTLLLQANVHGETPLHMAARYGHECTAKMLISHAKAIGEADLKAFLRAVNKQRDTAMHEAVRSQNVQIVAALLEEDSDLPNCVNISGESPLYLAAERGFGSTLRTIFNFCSSPSTDGPNGRTALHASTIANDQDSVEKILSKLVGLSKTADHYGWIPLHYAADLGQVNIASLLVEYDKDSTYFQDKEGKTALHIAAIKGNLEIMSHIMIACPSCIELVDNQGCNVLHLAVVNDKEEAVELILEDSSLSNLLHEKNLEGNTPLHHCVVFNASKSLSLLVSHPREDIFAFNNHNKNVLDIAITVKAKASILGICDEKDIDPGHRIKIDPPEIYRHELKALDLASQVSDKNAEYQMILAALIATVTFTAGFTVPGGFFSNEGSPQGTAVLGKNMAFKAFVISNTLAFVFSTLAVFLQILVLVDVMNNILRKIVNIVAAMYMTYFSLVAMIIAFICGSYAILLPYRSLAIATCVIGASFFLFFGLFWYTNFKGDVDEEVLEKLYLDV